MGRSYLTKSELIKKAKNKGIKTIGKSINDLRDDLHMQPMDKYVKQFDNKELDILLSKYINYNINGKQHKYDYLSYLFANKICKCIKNIDNKQEQISIAICINSILKNRGLKIKNWHCYPKPKIYNLQKK